MDLFTEHASERLPLATGATYLPRFALPSIPYFWPDLAAYLVRRPAQQMMTPMGYLMSVRTSSMGEYGWVSSAQGYGYSASHPITAEKWPPIPDRLLTLAAEAARLGGVSDFLPDSCLINVYHPKSHMGLHQDKDEQDFSQPIVSVSIGLSAIFLFGGPKRTDKTVKLTLHHGDVLVWGGASRHCYHGISRVLKGQHPLTGEQRINLTLRKAR